MKNTSKVAPAASANAPSGLARENSIMGLQKEGSKLALSEGRPPRSASSSKQVAPANKSMAFMFNIMEGRAWVTSISVLTVFALFGDDLRVCAMPMSLDNAFYTISFLALLAFIAELAVFTVAKPKYYKSFYFWLDIIATVTMVSDVGFIWEPFLALALSSGEGQANSQEALDAIQASRVGTKSSRIVRIVRLVRLVRVVKLYKLNNGENGVDDEVAEENPSLVGKKLSDKTMQRVITVVLSMLICVQFFDASMYSSSITQGSFGLYQLHYQWLQHTHQRDTGALTPAAFDDFFTGDFRTLVEQYTQGIEGGRLVYLTLHGSTDAEVDSILNFARETQWVSAETGRSMTTSPDISYTPSADIKVSIEDLQAEYRSTETEVAVSTHCFDTALESLDPGNATCGSVAYFDITGDVQLAAGLNMVQTVFVMFILTVGSQLFSKDADILVIRPIEKMVKSVKRLAENPMGDSELDVAETKDGEDDETVLLQRTIGKIGQLLQIGFGEAGSEIIAKNMSNNSGIEPMCDGLKIEAVFGFCDIRNFTDTTECLQEKVMVYVNKVGHIVHEATHTWYGAANKNIGDAFLLVWKVKDAKRNISVKGANAGNMCDNALVAFLKSIIDLKRENGPGGCLHEYKDNPAIRKRFGENNFEIRLGMGLHIGWAIEGTIGSKYKIDASYLSPNVNMAARLEAATKQFRTPLLLSEDFYDALSSKARKRCRMIDKVTVKGSIQPMGLFTCDIDSYPLEFGEKNFFEDGTRIPFDFDGPEMDAIQDSLPKTFLRDFNTAVASYLAGEWEQSRKELDEILVIKPEDGPALALLAVMETRGFKVPEDWKGFRELTEK